MRIRSANLIYWLVVIIIDIFVFLYLGILLMTYDDNYDGSKGEYWSFASMNPTEKLISLCFDGWMLLNIVGIGYIGFKIFKKSENA